MLSRIEGALLLLIETATRMCLGAMLICPPFSCRRHNRPQLILAIAMPFFQQWSG